MVNSSLVFTLHTYSCDVDIGSGETVLLETPGLEAFFSAQIAVEHNEGLTIVESNLGFGDLNFFAADGAPLRAEFSEQPQIHAERNAYFPGVYSLTPVEGKNLVSAISDIITSPHTQILVYLASNEATAHSLGWQSMLEMKTDVEQALEILGTELRKRVVFEEVDRSAL